jgi:hypothetical protein
VPSCLLEPIWGEFWALLGGERPRFDPAHPLGCHRRRVPDRVVFEHVIAALVHGSGYERIATAGCSDRTIRRRLKIWAALGIGEQVHALALRAYDQMIGLELGDVAVDGCITKAPCGGERAGPSPVDRRKGGVDGTSIWTPGHDQRQCSSSTALLCGCDPGRRGTTVQVEGHIEASTSGRRPSQGVTRLPGGCPTVRCRTICVDSEPDGRRLAQAVRAGSGWRRSVSSSRKATRRMRPLKGPMTIQ